MKKIICSIVLLLCVSSSYAQDEAHTIDSLKNALSKASEKQAIYILGELAIIAPDGQWQSYNLQMKKLAQKGVAKNDSNEVFYNQNYAEALNNEAFDYTEKGDYKNAISLYQECVAIQKKYKLDQALGLTYSNLGAIYERDGDIEHGIEYNNMALQLLKNSNAYSNLIAAYNNLGVLYSKQNNKLKAKESYLNAYEIYKKNKPANNTIPTILRNLGEIYATFQQKDSAYNYFKLALEKATEMGNVKGFCGIYEKYGDLYKSDGNTDSAFANYQRAYTIALKEHYLGDLLTASKKLYQLYKDNGENAKALEVLEVSVQTEKELKSDENKRATIKFQIANEYALKKATDSVAFAKAKAINELELQKVVLLNKSIEQEKELQELTILKTRSDLNAEQSKRSEKEKQLAITEKEKQIQSSKLKTQQKEIEKEAAQRNLLIGGTSLLVLLASSIFIGLMRTRKEKKKSEALRLKSDELLLNILPAEITNELKERGETTAKHFDEVTVLFTDFVEFTKISEQLSPQVLVQELHECFSAFDAIMERNGLEKIKTVGDAYIAVCGLPVANKQHAEKTVQAAIEIREFMENRKKQEKVFDIRIGIHSGPVVAGIVGVKKFAYDIWGDTVNTAARMEQSSEAGKINISETTYALVKDKFSCIHRGKISAKGKGEVDMYFVET